MPTTPPENMFKKHYKKIDNKFFVFDFNKGEWDKVDSETELVLNKLDETGMFFHSLGIQPVIKTKTTNAAEMVATPPEIEEIVKEFEIKWKTAGLDDVEEFCGCPPFSEEECACVSRKGKFIGWLRTTLTTLHQKHQEEVEKVIGQHNARILNAFQLEMKPDMPMVCYDERIALIPAVEKATRETLQAITPTKSDKQTEI